MREATPTTSAGTTSEATTAPTTTLAPTPACDDGDDPTPEQTEGPFFTPNSPERTSLREDGIDGTAFVLTGTVLATDCTQLAGALLDFWHADDSGEYDNEGYRLRGHQFTDANGAYRLETILPGLYTGRTRHIHVKAQREGGDVLTTQLYFPNEPRNESDGIFDPALLLSRRRRQRPLRLRPPLVRRPYDELHEAKPARGLRPEEARTRRRLNASARRRGDGEGARTRDLDLVLGTAVDPHLCGRLAGSAHVQLERISAVDPEGRARSTIARPRQPSHRTGRPAAGSGTGGGAISPLPLKNLTVSSPAAGR